MSVSRSVKGCQANRRPRHPRSGSFTRPAAPAGGGGAAAREPGARGAPSGPGCSGGGCGSPAPLARPRPPGPALPAPRRGGSRFPPAPRALGGGDWDAASGAAGGGARNRAQGGGGGGKGRRRRRHRRSSRSEQGHVRGAPLGRAANRGASLGRSCLGHGPASGRPERPPHPFLPARARAGRAGAPRPNYLSPTLLRPSLPRAPGPCCARARRG